MDNATEVDLCLIVMAALAQFSRGPLGAWYDIDAILMALGRAWLSTFVAVTWLFMMLVLAQRDGTAYLGAVADALAVAG